MSAPDFPDDRQWHEALDDLSRGARHAAAAFGLSLPPLPVHGPRARGPAEAFADPDCLHVALTEAWFDRQLDLSSVDPRQFAHLAEALGEHGLAQAAARHAVAHADASDQRLVALGRQRFEVTWPDLLAGFEQPFFASLKINHVQWEYLAWIGLSDAGRPVSGRFDAGTQAVFRRLYASGFDDLLLHAVKRFARHAEAACGYTGPAHALGFGVSNGDTSFAEDLETPLVPAVRGALCGLLGFCDSAGHSGTVTFADGGAVKSLFWTGRLHTLARLAAQSADCVVFVAPPWLSRIGLAMPVRGQENITVPARLAQELWPSVLAAVTGRIASLLDRHERVCVFLQAGAMSVPIGAALCYLQSLAPGKSLHCFDMGQVLDVAIVGEHGGGAWIKKPAVRAAAARQPTAFILR